MASFGSRTIYAKPRDERRMRANLAESELFPSAGRSSLDWMHKKLAVVQRGHDVNLPRTARMQQEDLLTMRRNEEKQIADLRTARRPQLIGEAARAQAAQRAAEQVYNMGSR